MIEHDRTWYKCEREDRLQGKKEKNLPRFSWQASYIPLQCSTKATVHIPLPLSYMLLQCVYVHVTLECDILESHAQFLLWLRMRLVLQNSFVHVQVGMFTGGYLREEHGLGSRGRIVLEYWPTSDVTIVNCDQTPKVEVRPLGVVNKVAAT